MSDFLPTRFIGLDVHKHYLIAIGVNAAKEQIFGPSRANLQQLEAWAKKHLTLTDALVFEMTGNTWQLYDDLKPFVHSITVVHPPHVGLITRTQVMTDKIAALQLARLHAVGLIPPLWIPPPAVRELRSLLAHRRLQVRLATQAKNRLHSVLQRHHLAPPEGALFAVAQRTWWDTLPVSLVERTRIQSDFATLAFAEHQRLLCEDTLKQLAAQDERLPFLVQLPGFGLIVALTVLAAIGEITRFPSAEKLVGYAGLGARVHDSGLTHTTGRITKAGRRELRAVLVEAAHVAANTHPHWQAELARLEPRLGRNKAIVALARKLLVTVWHVLTNQERDRYSEPARVARKLRQHANRLGKAHRRAGQRTADYVCAQLERMGIRADLNLSAQSEDSLRVPPSSRMTD